MKKIFCLLVPLLINQHLLCQENYYKNICLDFTCNMEFEIISGRFDPATDTLYVIGSMTNWLYAVSLQPGDQDSNLYHCTSSVSVKRYEKIFYRFYYHRSNGELSQEFLRTIYFNDTYYDADTVKIKEAMHNNFPYGVELENNREIVFTLNLGDSLDYNGNKFDEINNVFITGFNVTKDWPQINWPNESIENVIFLNDNGINGDKLANDQIWSTCIIDSADYYSFLEMSFLYFRELIYMYGINWGLESNSGSNCNESRRGVDHYLILNSTDAFNICVTDTFGVMGESRFEVVTSTNKTEPEFPEYFHLSQNYPNPFNPTTKIIFSLTRPSVTLSHWERDGVRVLLKIYDILGREITTLINDTKPPGTYDVEFDGSQLPSGVYFYRLNAGKYSETKKLVLMR